MEEPGKHSIGEYEILEEIDRGAQGSVYKARYVGDTTESLESGQLVALKRMVVEDHYLDRHAAFSGRLQHQNIVRVLDHFLDDSFEERPCIVMEYLDGVTLKEAVQQSGAQAGLAWDRVRDIFYQCIEGFQFAQNEGIVHRDVKPTNIFIINEREAKLIDFGVARQEDSESSLGGFRGTLVYMAPDFVKLEEFRGDEQSRMQRRKS